MIFWGVRVPSLNVMGCIYVCDTDCELRLQTLNKFIYFFFESHFFKQSRVILYEIFLFDSLSRFIKIFLTKQQPPQSQKTE